MIELDQEVTSRLAGAIEQGHALTAAYVDVAGKPHLSFYGSTHVHGPDQLAIWVRDPQGALLTTMAQRPHIAFLYGDIGSRVYYKFEGRARRTDEPEERARIYKEMHEIERRFDPDCAGVAVVIDLDLFTSLSAAGKVVQSRDPG